MNQSKKSVKPKVSTPASEEIKQNIDYVATGEGGFASPGNFGGFDLDNTALHRRVRVVERKIDELLEMRRSEREEEVQDREFHRNLKERVRKLEDENSKLKEKVEKYEKLMSEGLGKVEKEKANINAWMKAKD